MKKIFFHIGMHKTGSTAIQSAFNGFDDGSTRYANLGNENHSIPFYTAYSGHHQDYRIWLRQGLNAKQIDQKKTECLERIEREISDSQPKSIIISGEDISLLPLSALQDLHKIIDAKAKVEIIVYVRDPISFICSAFQEDIKNGTNGISPAAPHYQLRIQKFVTVFGQDNVIVRRFHRDHLYEQDIVKDFSNLINVTAPKSRRKSNVSLSTEAVKIIYLMNQMVPAVGKTKGNARERMIDHARETFPGKFDIPSHLISGCVDENDNEWLYSATQIDFRTPNADVAPFSEQALDAYLCTLAPDTIAGIQDYLNQIYAVKTVTQNTKFLIARYLMSFLNSNEKVSTLFDAKFLELNPDVKAAVVNPLDQDLLEKDGMRARKFRTGRTIFALLMREMSTSYGRSPGGYTWGILEPVLALALLSTVFAFIIDSPALGDSFPLFYATGYLPFMLFNDVANKVATSLNHSRPLLKYPAVTFVDALIARGLLHLLTHALVGYIIFFGMIVILDLKISPDYIQLFIAYTVGGLLGFGVGCFNCYAMMSYPAWERIWQILTRPLIFISGMFVPYDMMPKFAQDILWWNPLIHVVGFLRKGIYAPSYTGDYLSLTFPVIIALILMALGLLLLWRNHRILLEG